MSDKKLYEKLTEEFGKRGLKDLEIPAYIKENLSKELRIYQEEALKYYLANFESIKERHLMFNMATGSGKTLMMAALILDCYKRGYRDFIFFVDKTTIVEKTKANFADKTSSKYLFKNPIVVNSSHVEINVIHNLFESKEGCINLYFTTIQSLFSLLKYERENALSFEDFKDRKLVFLADEAHHLNADTKKQNKEEQEKKEGWEAITKRAFESHKENLMFEFSATIPRDSNVLEKYRDKIIYEYNLEKFCKDGYSKRIFVMKYENKSLQDRFLGGILLSLYRELLAQKYQIALKPVILFKSEAIKTSEANQEVFLEFLDNLDIRMIDNFYKSTDSRESELFAKSLEFFQKEFKEAYLENIVNYLKNNFKQTYILNTNDEKELEKNQILLNSLEDSHNQVRVIFTVDKLNEGWDVLNLFDIVRLGNKTSGAVTTKEAQLIGRGARYYPFKTNEFAPDLTYKRKFDNDLDNELSILERLSYHTLNEVEFIKNLNKSMRDQGLSFENKKRCINLTPNKKLEHIIKDNKIYYAKNKRIKKQDLKDFEITKEEMEQKIKRNIPLFAKGIKESEEQFKEIKEERDFQELAKLNRIPTKFFLKAMNMLGLGFKEINENFSVKSKNEFVENYLKNIDFSFSKKQVFNTENNLEIAKFILENFKKIKEEIKQEYEVTEFKAYRLNLGERVIFKSEEKDVTNLNLDSDNFEWLYYHNLSHDSGLEKEFLNFIEGNKEKINAVFSQWFIVRNDGFEEFKLFDNREGSTYGQGFEPDFIFFGKKKNENDKFLSIECFFEAKGGHLTTQDAWKEEFLQTIQNKKMQAEDKKLTLYSLPFFIEKKVGKNQKFIDAFNDFFGEK
ncbi:DEAD/DEAH box helicase family protein [Helicobacter anatolicus]|uniref:DEAD/DEAH box helicase family protein n=1 Tax=Helicobacter anatolicus TaxID=2905874 RepID=UPI001E2CDCDF|nr:DEAD/DEAH box helicase family protein [Helicobacter anatolicus]MCE3039221.1 DEAD/DEAH box helicase family protein [Helicobacter anatolicus]